MALRVATLALHVASAAAFSMAVGVRSPVKAQLSNAMMMTTPDVPAALTSSLLVADSESIFSQLEAFQQSHAFLISIMLAIATRLVILEIRRQVEKPVMDKLGEAAKEQLTPDTEQIGPVAWAQLVGCIALDLAGDASELIPFLGEFTDVAYAPVEAGLLYALFKSPLLGGLGFVEEILPFTDVVPTFCIGWCLQHLWPTTPVAQKMGILPKSKA